MKTVNMHEAKTHLSRLVREVAAGEEIIIAKAGEPVAKIVPYAPLRKPRKAGSWKGKVWMADDFDELPEEIMKAFNGENDIEPPA